MESIIREDDIYEVLKNNTENFDKIIRHFKIISRSDYNSDVEKVYMITSKAHGYNYIYNDALSQDISSYANGIIIEPLNLHNNYKDDNVLTNKLLRNISNGSLYSTIKQLKEKISKLKTSTSNSYVNDIINSLNEDELESITEILNRFINGDDASMYIRMAPDPSMKEDLLKRICVLNGNTLLITDEAFSPVAEDGIPVLNDNLAYSNKKYDSLKQQLQENGIEVEI